MNTRVVTAHIPVQLADKVDEAAQRLERSKAWVIKQALAAWVDQEDERYRFTLEALQDVDDENVIDHQSVKVWAQSLGTDSPLLMPR
jgi:predicted transcriptional regulator